MIKLENIGFYTLSEERARTANENSVIKRLEICLTDKCNFKCPYCRGVPSLVKGTAKPYDILKYIKMVMPESIRFTGGEPTLYDNKSLKDLIMISKLCGAKHIALSTNGTADINLYKELIDCGVNDFSISLDGACCSVGDEMSGGVKNAWNTVTENIKILSSLTYVSVGMVFTEQNIDQCKEAVLFADSLGVSDIRVIPSAQYNQALYALKDLPDNVLKKYKILNYRIKNISHEIPIRGLKSKDSCYCPLVLDDVMIAGKYQYPCPIWFREGGEPIGTMNDNWRMDRKRWFNVNNTHLMEICKNNCLDVCRQYNNRWYKSHNG